MENESKSIQLSELNPSKSTLTLIAMFGGVGIVVIVVALGYGVSAVDANANTIGMFVLIGLALLAFSIGGWTVAVQPFGKFDDINKPLDDGHHGHSHAEPAEHTEEAH